MIDQGYLENGLGWGRKSLESLERGVWDSRTSFRVIQWLIAIKRLEAIGVGVLDMVEYTPPRVVPRT